MHQVWLDYPLLKYTFVFYYWQRQNSFFLNISISRRHSIEALWRSLNDSNPELLVDFEDFVAEIAGEVQGAQRALE